MGCYTSVSTTPIVIHSPTFDNIFNQPITSLFEFQSTDLPITHEEEEAQNDDENEFDGTFSNIEFDPEEENILDNMLLTRKQFRILNKKLNSLLQIQDGGGNKHSVSSLEVDIMLKRQENRVHEAIFDINRNNEKQVKAQSSNFAYDLKELKVVAKERHILFIQDVKKVREDVNFKLQELRKIWEKRLPFYDKIIHLFIRKLIS
ncbi:unnamed protein product [Lactuca saligna]|uniref:Uncharacterized protein n=1 Tax=Lactuca saligna TaxID=75948 RepID=A0AA36DZB8_LACSI|nr:unnamed protein product [Lactuca saligna]